jgi:RNA polymerase sigma-70 factor (ECF subfamily)
MVDLYRRHLGAQRRDVRREQQLERAGTFSATSRYMAADLAAQMTSPSQRAVRAEFEATVEAALAEMSGIDQEVLALRHFEEMTNNQVADVLGLSPAAASNRYFRALKRLRTILKTVPGFLDEYAPAADSTSGRQSHESPADPTP